MSAIVGAVLLVAPKDPVLGAPAPNTTYIYESGPEPTTTPTAESTPGPSMVALPVPDGYERVAGPGGLVTTIPANWPITRSSGAGAMQATDPTDRGRYVRYGGAPAPRADLLQAHVDYEATFAKGKANFKRLSLGTATYHGVTAVDWEFEHEVDGVSRRVHSMYWRVGATEYFLYAASDSATWAKTLPVYHAMIDNATP